MKKQLAVVLALLLGGAPMALAETQATANTRLVNMLTASGITSKDVLYIVSQLKSTVLYATAAELLAAAPADGVMGYAQDTDVYYLMTAGSWVSTATLAAMANGATITNAADGTIVATEGGEAWSWVVTNNLWTFTSTTGATFAFTPAVTFTGDVTLAGGAGALTCGAASCSLLGTDNSALGFVLGSTGSTATLAIDSTDSAEGVAVTGYGSVSGLFTGTGGVKTTKPLFNYDKLRFCGNGSNGTTPWFDGPVLESDTATDFSLGSAGCDGNDSATEGTADRPIDAYSIIKIVGMACVTQAGGTSNTNTFQLRTATADVAGVTCAVTNDNTLAKQCSVILAAPVAIALGATLAVKNVQSGSDDMSAKDMGCTAYYSY